MRWTNWPHFKAPCCSQQIGQALIEFNEAFLSKVSQTSDVGPEIRVLTSHKIQHLQRALYLKRAQRSARGRLRDFWVPKTCVLSDWKHNGRLIATHWYVCGTKMGAEGWQHNDGTIMYVPCAGCFSLISESSLRSDWLSREALIGFSLQPPRRPQCCPSKEDRYHLQVVVGTADKSDGSKS